MKSFLKLALISCICIAYTAFSSCEPETIIETEFITVNDTLIVSTTDTIVETEVITIYDTLIVSITDTIFIPDESDVTTFILVRHADIPSGGDTDPFLNQTGLERAEKLASILSELNLEAVYSTTFNRTTQTAIPTANNQGLNITTYGGFDHEEVIDEILENMDKSKILIVGHGNTTPNFINALTGSSTYPDLSEDAFDNLFIVNTKSKGDSEVIHLKY